MRLGVDSSLRTSNWRITPTPLTETRHSTHFLPPSVSGGRHIRTQLSVSTMSPRCSQCTNCSDYLLIYIFSCIPIFTHLRFRQCVLLSMPEHILQYAAILSFPMRNMADNFITSLHVQQCSVTNLTHKVLQYFGQ